MKLTLPGDQGRLTLAPDLYAEQRAELLASEARLRAGDRGPRSQVPLRVPPWERGRRAFLLGCILPMVLASLVAQWLMDLLGFWWVLGLMGLLWALLMAFGGVVDRYREKKMARAPERILAGYEGRYISPGELDLPSRRLLLRAQRVVDTTADPSALAAREWELALLLRENTHAWRRARPDQDDEWAQSTEAMLRGLQKAEILLREMETSAAQAAEGGGAA